MSDSPIIPDDYMMGKWKELEYKLKIKLDLIDAIERAAEETVKHATKQIKEAREAKGISND